MSVVFLVILIVHHHLHYHVQNRKKDQFLIELMVFSDQMKINV